MKKLIIMIGLFLSVCHLAYTQANQFDKTWIVGIGTMKLIFNMPNIDTTGYTTFGGPFYGGHSNICDTNGNLVMICDGFSIFDNNCNIISNGDSLVGKEYIKGNGSNLYSQTSIILPFPNKKYYVFTPSMTDTQFFNTWGVDDTVFLFDELLYHVIDMNANGGAGAVVKKGVKALEGVALNKTNMMACKHANGKDWWLLKQAKGVNTIYKFLVTADSVYNYGVQSFAEPYFGKIDGGGQAMFSPDGSKYAACVVVAGGTNNGQVVPGTFCLSDFDRCTGIVSNPKVYHTKPSPCANLDPNCFENYTVGLCFSPNGRFLYVNSSYSIKQLDTWDTDTATQWSLVYGPRPPGVFGSQSLGPDGKIYIGHYGGNNNTTLAVIDSPDVKGVGCNVCFGCIHFPDVGVSGPPCMPDYHLGAKEPCWPLGNEELEILSDELEVYPNPTSTLLFIKTASSEKRELYNSIGQLLISTKANEINVSKLAKGIYYLRCGSVTKKVFIE